MVLASWAAALPESAERGLPPSFRAVCLISAPPATPARGGEATFALAVERRLWREHRYFPRRPCSVRAGQGAAGAHFRWPRMRALARMRSFRMIATIATLVGFPALIMASYLVLNSGLHRMALRAGM